MTAPAAQASAPESHVLRGVRWERGLDEPPDTRRVGALASAGRSTG